MQGAYGGLVVILNYAVTAEQAHQDDFALITDDNIFILTDDLKEILI